MVYIYCEKCGKVYAHGTGWIHKKYWGNDPAPFKERLNLAIQSFWRELKVVKKIEGVCRICEGDELRGSK